MGSNIFSAHMLGIPTSLKIKEFHIFVFLGVRRFLSHRLNVRQLHPVLLAPRRPSVVYIRKKRSVFSWVIAHEGRCSNVQRPLRESVLFTIELLAAKWLLFLPQTWSIFGA